MTGGQDEAGSTPAAPTTEGDVAAVPRRSRKPRRLRAWGSTPPPSSTERDERVGAPPVATRSTPSGERFDSSSFRHAQVTVIGKPPRLKPSGLRVRPPPCALGIAPASGWAFEAFAARLDTAVPNAHVAQEQRHYVQTVASAGATPAVGTDTRSWRIGRRAGLRCQWGATPVRVRFPPIALDARRAHVHEQTRCRASSADDNQRRASAESCCP